MSDRETGSELVMTSLWRICFSLLILGAMMICWGGAVSGRVEIVGGGKRKGGSQTGNAGVAVWLEPRVLME